MLQILLNTRTLVGFIPHGHCYLWDSSLVLLHLLSDLTIALAYYSIPVILIYFVRKRTDLPYPEIFLLFGAFIISCGTTHLMEIWIIWHPNYWVSGFIKLFTAIISLYTAIATSCIIPKALNIPSSKQLEATRRELEKEIVERQKIEIALRESEERYRTIVEDQTESIARFKPDRTLTFINQAYCRYFGKKREQLIGNIHQAFVFTEDREKLDRVLNSLNLENPVGEEEYRAIVNGQVRWMQWIDRAIFDDKGNFVEFQSVGRDISDRKEAEFKIAASLQEKEVLLKEIHHRVKNNLQIICSLLRLQSRHLKDPVILEKFQETQNRVESMAMIHEQLYLAKNFSQIPLFEYLQELVNNLFRSYGVLNIVRKIDVAKDFFLDIDTAVSCGLIVNELISNAIKYAFEPSRGGEITVRANFDEENNIVLSVKDNGKGLPVNFDLEKTNTLGLKLVKSLAKQLRGTIEICVTNGTDFKITLNKK